MAYDSDNSVENESYCMPSWNKRNTDMINKGMGYDNMADRANAAKPPTPVRAANSNPQIGPKNASNNYDYQSLVFTEMRALNWARIFTLKNHQRKKYDRSKSKSTIEKNC